VKWTQQPCGEWKYSCMYHRKFTLYWNDQHLLIQFTLRLPRFAKKELKTCWNFFYKQSISPISKSKTTEKLQHSSSESVNGLVMYHFKAALARISLHFQYVPNIKSSSLKNQIQQPQTEITSNTTPDKWNSPQCNLSPASHTTTKEKRNKWTNLHLKLHLHHHHSWSSGKSLKTLLFFCSYPDKLIWHTVHWRGPSNNLLFTPL